jgi:hypothetical protein
LVSFNSNSAFLARQDCGKIFTMSSGPTWKKDFEKELLMAENARAVGNEGMARVCSRRAAGIIIKEYTHRKGYSHSGSSVYEQLKWLQSEKKAPPQAHEIATLLLTRVDYNHNLPQEVDLIQETRNLAELLLEI